MCPSQSNRLSGLLSVDGCHSLQVTFTEIHTFLCSISLVHFLSTPYLLTILWNEKQTLTWFFWHKKKKLKKTGVSSILPATVIGPFSGIFRIRSSSISAYSWRLKDNTSFSVSKKLFVIYSLSVYYSSSTGERAEYITEDEKDQFDIVMQTSSNTQ